MPTLATNCWRCRPLGPPPLDTTKTLRPERSPRSRISFKYWSHSCWLGPRSVWTAMDNRPTFLQAMVRRSRDMRSFIRPFDGGLNPSGGGGGMVRSPKPCPSGRVVNRDRASQRAHWESPQKCCCAAVRPPVDARPNGSESQPAGMTRGSGPMACGTLGLLGHDTSTGGKMDGRATQYQTVGNRGGGCRSVGTLAGREYACEVPKQGDWAWWR